MPKCILATQRVHFPSENVQLCKNAFLHHIFQRKMFSITFSKEKCSAKQNVTNTFLQSKKRKAMQNAYTHGYTLILLL